MSSSNWEREEVRGWGGASRGEAMVARPQDLAQLQALFAEAARTRTPMALRGAGCSYGDAAMLTAGHVVDLTRMNRILDFDAATGIVRAEPGVTIRDLWRHTIGAGYWPVVVPGTMAVTLGGAAAMNIHGKNNFAVGSFGEHVRALRLLLPDGGLVRCTRTEQPELFHAAIGGFGMLGAFVELELQLKQVHSGRLRVQALLARDLDANLQILEEHRQDADYLVSWLDGYARGGALGRGLVHRADHFAPGEDPVGERMLSPAQQDVPAYVLGCVPKGWLWPALWLLVKGGGLRGLNAAKFAAARREVRQPPYPQTHGAFHFLLDYVPGWKRAFWPGGLIQFQPFVPAAGASRVLRQLLASCQHEALVPYLLVLKRHRADPFLMTHAIDGFSLAMEFAVTAANRTRLWEHCARMAEVVLDAGGRFYYAKDGGLAASSFTRIHGTAAVQKFRELKLRHDPQNLLQTDLSRRLGVLGGLVPAPPRA